MLIGLASCTRNGSVIEKSYLKEYVALVEKTEKDFKSLSDEQFEERMNALYLYSSDYYESVKKSLSEEEKQQVGRLQARCTKIAVARGIEKGSEELNDFIDVATGFLDEILK